VTSGLYGKLSPVLLRDEGAMAKDERS
jgi:hypothetical protein